MCLKPMLRCSSCERCWREEKKEEGAWDRLLPSRNKNRSSERWEKDEAKEGREELSKDQKARLIC